MALLALAAVAAALLATLRDGTRGDAPAHIGPPSPVPSDSTQPTAPVSPALRFQVGDSQPSTSLEERPPLDQRPRFPDEQRFAGFGRIEGRLALPEGTPVPAHWTLVLEPSRALIGGDRARGQRVEFVAAEIEFTISDVPLGGYEIWAESPGMSGRHEHLLLARPDAQFVVQNVHLRTAAFVEGRVLDEHGQGPLGLPVWLLPLEGGAPLQTICDGGGNYLFTGVPDGEYRIALGFADAPLAKPRELAVLPPSLHMPELRVPELFTLEVLVLSTQELPLEGALVRGWCSAGGRISMESDALGQARALWIPRGRLTLEASMPGHNEQGLARVHLDYPGEPDGIVELRMQR